MLQGAGRAWRRAWPRLRWLAAAMVFAANFLLASYLLPGATPRLDVPYTLFKREVVAGNVVEVVSRGEVIQGTFREPVTWPPSGTRARSEVAFATVRPAFADPGLEQLLDAQGVIVNARPLEEPRSWWMSLLLGFGPTALIIALIVWLSRRMGFGSMFTMGRSRARRYDLSDRNHRVTFADVAGIEEAKAELVEIVEFLKHPGKFTQLGGTVPKGVLLVGPPGTGKTLLARALAGEAGVPFFSIGASEFVEMITGVGASRVRDLFKQAREAAPAIIFIDELDAIGRVRSSAALNTNRESEQTLNQILTEMDGFTSREAVIVVAATNRADVLDPALLRPGRFDRRITVQPPDRPGREAILTVHTRGVPLGTDVSLTQLAAATPGLAGAELKNLVNEAALLAARRNKKTVDQVEFLDALEKIVLGPARQLLLSPEDRRRIAYHEAGHTILGLVVPGADPVNRVTIMPRGGALGVTYQRPEDDRHNLSEDYLRARMIGALGGRAAEALVFGTRTTGAQNDLQLVTAIARQMVTQWGMSDTIGPVAFGEARGGSVGAMAGMAFEPQATPYSETTARLIDAEIQRLVEACNQEAVRLLADHRDALDALASALLEHETLDEGEILRVTGLSRTPAQTAPPLPAGRGVAG